MKHLQRKYEKSLNSLNSSLSLSLSLSCIHKCRRLWYPMLQDYEWFWRVDLPLSPTLSRPHTHMYTLSHTHTHKCRRHVWVSNAAGLRLVLASRFGFFHSGPSRPRSFPPHGSGSLLNVFSIECVRFLTSVGWLRANSSMDTWALDAKMIILLLVPFDSKQL
jgi:hypothetical protein